MRLVVAVVGKARNPALGEAIRDYETRAARYWPLDVHEVREERAAGKTSIEIVKDKEGDRLAERIPGGAHTVVCEQGGRPLDSSQFADFLRRARDEDRDLAFVIGGAFGLATNLSSRAATKLSLAPWTLPHEIARLVLAEQIYRAGTIVRGEPYHK
ncbi:MAG TPA: 23S rRNA (pseudouridine(1915)-N(3))-methyltransferase RlmH [Gemmatimonadaceae bacterium]|jgi:23S rRNA (pseudouridine1915-N3)-methyltransferase|nr:23S rRNA (pseudouridine(1915)-N(3))-methyltransferase RlmH [Gemmatimonadaceae bacterium]